MTHQGLRFSISDLLLATFLSALPLAFNQWTGLVPAVCLSVMSLALTFGYGLVALVLMCISLVAAANSDTSLTRVHLSVGAFVTTVALTVIIALALRFSPKREV